MSWDKVILGCRVGLHNIPSLSTNIEIVDLGTGGHSVRAGSDAEHEATVLETTASLGSVDGKGDVDTRGLNIGVILNGGLGSVQSGVSGIIDLSNRDVVSETKDTGTASVGNAVLIGSLGEGPVEGVGSTVNSVSEMVVTVVGGFVADGGSLAEGWDTGPLAIGSSTVTLVVGSLLGIGGSRAIVLCLHVCTLSLIVSALALVVNKNGDISPSAGVPVGVVVSLLTAFQSVALAVGILAGGHSSLVVGNVLLCSEQSLVPASCTASLIGCNILIHSISEGGSITNIGVLVVVVVGSISRVGASGDGGSGSTITDNPGLVSTFGIIRAHVLQDDITIGVVVTARVLVGPLNRQFRSFDVREFGAPAVSTTGIVLTVKQTLGILTVTIFIQAIIVSPGVLHIYITIYRGKRAQGDKYNK